MLSSKEQVSLFYQEFMKTSEEDWPLYDERWLDGRCPELVVTSHLMKGQTRTEIKQGFDLKSKTLTRLIKNINTMTSTTVSGQDKSTRRAYEEVESHDCTNRCVVCRRSIYRDKMDVFGRLRSGYFMPYYLVPRSDKGFSLTSVYASCEICVTTETFRNNLMNASDKQPSTHAQYIADYLLYRTPKSGYKCSLDTLLFDGKALELFDPQFLDYPNPQLVISYHLLKSLSKAEIQSGFGITSKTYTRVHSRIISKDLADNVDFLPFTTTKYYKLMENQDTSKCVKCGRSLTPHSKDCFGRQKEDCLTAYHIYPVSQFPDLQYEATNLRSSCKECNDKLGCSIDEELKHTVAHTLLYNFKPTKKPIKPGPCWAKIDAGKLLREGSRLYFSLRFKKGAIEPHISTKYTEGSQEVDDKTINGYISALGWPQSEWDVDPEHHHISQEGLSKINKKLMESSDWTLEQLRTLKEAVEDLYGGKEVSSLKLIEFVRRYPGINHRFQAIDLSGSNIKHMMDLVEFSFQLKKNGHRIYCLEGVCSVDGKLTTVMEDLDLCFSIRDWVYLVDIKTQPFKKEWTESKSGTYSDLSTPSLDISNRIFPGECFQISFPGKKYDRVLKMSHCESFSYSNEFENAEQAITLAQSFSLEEVKGCFDHLALRLKTENKGFKDLHSSQTYSDSMVSSATNMIKSNSSFVAEAYEDLMSECAGLGQKKKDHLCTSYYEDVSKLHHKPFIKHTPLIRSDYKNVDDMVSKCVSMTKTPGMIWLLSLCTDQEWHPNGEELEYARMERGSRFVEMDSDTLQNIQIKAAMRVPGRTTPTAIKFRVRTGTVKEFMKGTLTGRGDYRQACYDNRHRVSSKRTISSFQELEDLLSADVSILSESDNMPMTRNTKVMWTMIGQLRVDTRVDEKIQDVIGSTYQRIAKTKCHDLLEQISQIYELSSLSKKKIKPMRKIKAWTGRSSVESQEVYMSVSNYDGRLGFSFNTISSVDAKDSWQFSAGAFQAYSLNMAWPHRGTMSEPTSISLVQENWGVSLYARGLSWFTMRLNVAAHTMPKMIKERQRTGEGQVSMTTMVFGTLLGFINNSRFSQSSEIVRYFFNNSTGISGDVSKLYEKISRYKPAYLITKLYMLRLHKMVTCFSMIKANRRQKEIITSSKSSQLLLDKHYSFDDWEVAFPHEEEPSSSQQNLFNSFYVCKNLSVFRHTKIMSEAEVVLKAQKNRLDYIERYEDKTTFYRDKVALINAIKSAELEGNGVYKANFPVLIFSAVWSIYTVFMAQAKRQKRYFKKHKHKSIGNIAERMFNLSEVTGRVRYSEMYNNRGGVRDEGPNGLCVSHDVSKRNVHEKKGAYSWAEDDLRKSLLDSMEERVLKQKKKQYEEKGEACGAKKFKVTMDDHMSINQNIRCYAGLIKNYSQMLSKTATCESSTSFKSIKAPIMGSMENKLTIEDVKKVLKYPDWAWPVLLYNLERKAPSIAKMVHKDQIGPREIAVLNTHLRVICKVLEDDARKIEAVEHALGDTTNLIDRSKKKELVMTSYRHHKKKVIEGNLDEVFDSADNSQWGPSIIAWSMYITLGMRTTNQSKRLIQRACLESFSNKVIKIPDVLFQSYKPSLAEEYRQNKTQDSSYSNSVHQCYSDMEEWEFLGVGDLKKQIFESPEGMFMGTLGSTSSVFHSDAMRLSSSLIEDIMSFMSVEIVNHATSDDSGRLVNYTKPDQVPDFPLTRGFARGSHHRKLIEVLNGVHLLILNSVGIKRNEVKSFFSKFLFEFNSVFFTIQGMFEPTIKSRLAYVDYSHDHDLYLSALKSVNQAQEFQRNNGGVIGAYWVHLINNLLHVKQFQLESFLFKHPNEIHVTPLELGGLVQPDCARQLSYNLLARLWKNYSQALTNKEVVGQTFAFTMLMSKDLDRPERLSQYDDDWGKANYIPSVGRSGIAYVANYVPKRVRIMREIIDQLTLGDLLPLLEGRWTTTQIKGIIDCVLREEAVGSRESSDRFRDSQIPRDAVLYAVRSKTYQLLSGAPKVNRQGLEDIRDKWKKNKTGRRQETSMGDIKLDELKINYKELFDRTKSHINKTETEFRMIDVPKVFMVRINQVLHEHQVVVDYTDYSFVVEAMSKFENEMLPDVLEGKLNPLVFLENRTLVSRKHKKLQRSKCKVKLNILESEVSYSWGVKLLLSNFCEGQKMLMTALRVTERDRQCRVAVNILKEVRCLKGLDQKDMDSIHMFSLNTEEGPPPVSKVRIDHLMEHYWNKGVKSLRLTAAYQEVFNEFCDLPHRFLIGSQVLRSLKMDRAGMTRRVSDEGKIIYLTTENTVQTKYNDIIIEKAKYFEHNQLLDSRMESKPREGYYGDGTEDRYKYVRIPESESLLGVEFRRRNRHVCMYVEKVLVAFLEPEIPREGTAIKVLALGPNKTTMKNYLSKKIDSWGLSENYKNQMAIKFRLGLDVPPEEVDSELVFEEPELGELFSEPDEEEQDEMFNFLFQPMNLGIEVESDEEPEPPDIDVNLELDKDMKEADISSVSSYNPYRQSASILVETGVPRRLHYWLEKGTSRPKIVMDAVERVFEMEYSDGIQPSIYSVDFGVRVPESELVEYGGIKYFLVTPKSPYEGVLGSVWERFKTMFNESKVLRSDVDQVAYCIYKNFL